MKTAFLAHIIYMIFFFIYFLVCPVNIANLLYVQRKKQKSLEDIVKTLNFAASIWGIRRKDDNLYGLQGRFEPHFYKPSLNLEMMALFILTTGVQ